MDETTAGNLIIQALDRYFERDGDLPYNMERSVGHRLAVYIEELLREGRHTCKDGKPWSVDCEFNRSGPDTDRDSKRDKYKAKKNAKGEVIGGVVTPDIVVHRRGERGPNLIAIEVKPDGTMRADLDVDRTMLRGYKRDYGYEHAFLVVVAEARSDGDVEPV